MKFISLVDTHNQNIITINADSFLLRIELDGSIREKRIKPFMSSLLYELFHQHPHPLAYDRIIEILRDHKLIISDLTRMHRKLSEIRKCLQKLYPSLGELILNTRSIGYSLPLRLKNLHQLTQKQDSAKFSNNHLTKALKILETVINDSILMTSNNKIIKNSQGYMINRDPIKDAIVEIISTFNECEKTILHEIRTHEADFIALRINYCLAKLKTYVGLARISEYPISEAQWLDWFKEEVWMLYEELKKLMSLAENL
jgi:hypothetical protein